MLSQNFSIRNLEASQMCSRKKRKEKRTRELGSCTKLSLNFKPKVGEGGEGGVGKEEWFVQPAVKDSRMSYHHNIGNGRLRVQGLGFWKRCQATRPEKSSHCSGWGSTDVKLCKPEALNPKP